MSTPSEAPPPPQETKPAASISETAHAYRWIILFALVLAAIMEVLDTTIVNVALPTMAGNLNCTTDEIAWVSTAYILANVVVLPMTAWLAQRFGTKRYLIVSILTFLAASILCAVSHSLPEIVIWRLVQGAAGAPLISLTQATILEIFPRKQHDMAQSIWGLGIIVAPTIGPALGGWLTDTYSWPWIFYVNVPVALLGAFLIWQFLPVLRKAEKSGGIDYFGILLLAAGLGSIQYVLEEGNKNDWFQDLTILRLTMLGVVSMIIFVWWQLAPGNTAPIVDLRILKDRAVAAGLVLNAVLGFGVYVGLYLYPIFAQGVLGFTPTKTGLTLLPGGAATGFGMIFCGVAMTKGVKARSLVIFGMFTFFYAHWLLGHLSFQSNEFDTGLGLLWRGFACGFLFMPIAAAAIAGLRGAAIAQGSALTGLGRQLGGSFGIAIAATYVSHMSAFHRVNLIANFYSGNPALIQRVQGATQLLVTRGLSPTSAQAAAVGLIDLNVQAQSYTMAINDAFLLVLVVFVLAFPLVFLLRGSTPAGPPPAAH